jgi:hypothetical protein
MIGITAGLVCACCSAQAQAAQTTPDEEQETVFHGRDNRVYVVQCGLDATIFVLEYFHLEYPLKKVSSGLPL